jgi:hypothetical protein
MLLGPKHKQAVHMSSRGPTGTVGSNRVCPCMFGLVCVQAGFRVITSLPVLLVSGNEDEKRSRLRAADALGEGQCKEWQVVLRMNWLMLSLCELEFHLFFSRAIAIERR